MPIRKARKAEDGSRPRTGTDTVHQDQSDQVPIASGFTPINVPMQPGDSSLVRPPGPLPGESSHARPVRTTANKGMKRSSATRGQPSKKRQKLSEAGGPTSIVQCSSADLKHHATRSLPRLAKGNVPSSQAGVQDSSPYTASGEQRCSISLSTPPTSMESLQKAPQQTTVEVARINQSESTHNKSLGDDADLIDEDDEIFSDLLDLVDGVEAEVQVKAATLPIADLPNPIVTLQYEYRSKDSGRNVETNTTQRSSKPATTPEDECPDSTVEEKSCMLRLAETMEASVMQRNTLQESGHHEPSTTNGSPQGERSDSARPSASPSKLFRIFNAIPSTMDSRIYRKHLPSI